MSKLTTVTITDLKVRTIIGIFDWERKEKQDLIINVNFQYDAAKAIKHDDIQYSVDYKAITKEIIKKVEGSNYQLIEKLANELLKIVLKPAAVLIAHVRVDKPGALRFAESVSVELMEEKQ